MRILIDGDGCPVVDLTVEIAAARGVECLILCDTAHCIQRPVAKTVVVSKGADSVDFALVNLLRPRDVAVTQDYGLAALCLTRGARALRQDGMEYTDENINGLLMVRYTAGKIRRGGGRLKGPKKRTAAEDAAFAAALCRILEQEEH